MCWWAGPRAQAWGGKGVGRHMAAAVRGAGGKFGRWGWVGGMWEGFRVPYIKSARPHLVANSKEPSLFLNMQGKASGVTCRVPNITCVTIVTMPFKYVFPVQHMRRSLFYVICRQALCVLRIIQRLLYQYAEKQRSTGRPHTTT